MQGETLGGEAKHRFVAAGPRQKESLLEHYGGVLMFRPLFALGDLNDIFLHMTSVTQMIEQIENTLPGIPANALVFDSMVLPLFNV